MAAEVNSRIHREGIESLKPEKLAKESADINKLNLAAKMGDWTSVLQILGTPNVPRKAYLINCIPEYRRWATLHQAIWYNDLDVVKELLKFADCDSRVQTKPGASEGVGYETPTTIADRMGLSEISRLLFSHHNTLYEHDSPTYVSGERGKNIKKYGPPLLLMGVANYRKTFHPRDFVPAMTFLQLMEGIFQWVDSGINWKEVREKMKESLYTLTDQDRDNLFKSDCKRHFYKSVIKVYTNEDFNVYRMANAALRVQGCQGYRPNGEDLSLGPYMVMLQAILLYWPELRKMSGTTYRRVCMSHEEIVKYAVGTRFIWLSFTSSSANESATFTYAPEPAPAGKTNIKFVIENSGPSIWQPRYIEEHSGQPHEHEGVFPVGAEFQVTSNNLASATIGLKLMQ